MILFKLRFFTYIIMFGNTCYCSLFLLKDDYLPLYKKWHSNLILLPRSPRVGCVELFLNYELKSLEIWNCVCGPDMNCKSTKSMFWHIWTVQVNFARGGSDADRLTSRDKHWSHFPFFCLEHKNVRGSGSSSIRVRKIVRSVKKQLDIDHRIHIMPRESVIHSI